MTSLIHSYLKIGPSYNNSNAHDDLGQIYESPMSELVYVIGDYGSIIEIIDIMDLSQFIDQCCRSTVRCVFLVDTVKVMTFHND